MEALEQRETPEALEGLGRALWWLDDAQRLGEARERAYQLYRERDHRGAARLALHLAEDALVFRAEEAVFNGWMQRARRLLDDLELCAEHAFLAVREAFFTFLLAGDVTTARDRAGAAIGLARRFRLLDLEMLALSIEGASLVADGRVAEGMRRLDEATAAATGGEMHDLELIGQTCCFMIYGCERVRGFGRAAQWCQRVQELCRRFGLRYLLAVCRTLYATVLTARGEWAEAEAELVGATEQLAQRPAQAVEAVVRLGELRRRQGASGRSGEPVRQGRLLPGGAGRTRSARSRHRRRGRSRRLGRAVPSPGRRCGPNAAGAWARAARACTCSMRRRGRCARRVGRTADACRDDRHRPLPCRGGIRRRRRRGGRGEARKARALLLDAVDLYGRSGLVYEAAEARLALAELVGAADEATRAAEAFESIGAAHQAQRARTLASASAQLLTRHENDILQLVAEGLSNKQIAARLTLSEHTVHRHVANILVKLRVSSRAAATATAAKHGLLE